MKRSLLMVLISRAAIDFLVSLPYTRRSSRLVDRLLTSIEREAAS